MHPLPLFLLLSAAAAAAAAPIPTIEHIDPTLPSALPNKPPDCSVHVLQYSISDDLGSSASLTLPPACPALWTRVILDLSVTASDLHSNHISSVWFDAAEVLRTTTPLSLPPGASWRIHKDITRHTSLLRRLNDTGLITMLLHHNTTSSLPASYTANLTLHFYRGWIDDHISAAPHPTVKALYPTPADLILPISAAASGGYWFKTTNTCSIAKSVVSIPKNTYRAVLEIFASYHADDELWYANPLRNTDAGRSNGGYRQVFATIDGKFVGGHIPFPVIYPSSINPFLWSPITSIAAFDLPTYDLDVTPFLSLLLDGNPHEIRLGVKDGQRYWLLTANLHVWVDLWSTQTTAGMIEYRSPEPAMTRHAEWEGGDGSSEVAADGLVRYKGWLSSSRGNLTTEVRQKVTFKSQVAVQNRGLVTQVEMVHQERTTVGTHRGSVVVGRVRVFVEAPMQVQVTRTAEAAAGEERARVSHGLMETVVVSDGRDERTTEMTDRQEAEGAAMVRDGVVAWGSGGMKAYYKYRDGGTCYLRTVEAVGGVVTVDQGSASCAMVESY